MIKINSLILAKELFRNHMKVGTIHLDDPTTGRWKTDKVNHET
jgi:hypothetical protein